jgi:hypothetical protein
MNSLKVGDKVKYLEKALVNPLFNEVRDALLQYKGVVTEVEGKWIWIRWDHEPVPLVTHIGNVRRIGYVQQELF